MALNICDWCYLPNDKNPKAPSLKLGRTKTTSLDLAYLAEGLIFPGDPPIKLSAPIKTITGRGLSYLTYGVTMSKVRQSSTPRKC